MSSFSVTAASFVPGMPSSAGGWTVAGGNTAAVPPQHGTRRVVCSSYFQTAFCTDGDFCSFAHHMDELEPVAKSQLLGLMADNLPLHFVGSRHAAGGSGLPSQMQPSEPSGSGRTTPTAFTPYGNPSQVSSRWRPGLEDEPVRVRLPARCRYPHQVPGTYYDHLNVKRNASPEAIEEAYRTWRSVGYKTAKALDPAKADAMDRLVVDAKNVLSNVVMRREYDVQLPAQTTPINSPSKVIVKTPSTPCNTAAASTTIQLVASGSAAGDVTATSGRSTPIQQPHLHSSQALNPALFDDIWTK